MYSLHRMQGRGQNILFGDYSPSHGERGSVSLYLGGGYAPVGSRAKLVKKS